LSDDSLQKIDDTMFDNHFYNKNRFIYSKPSDNEDDIHHDVNNYDVHTTR
jgi:hypothetical protein